MQLIRTYAFEAAHLLPRVPPGHKCGFMHGHSYTVEIIVEGELDESAGWVIDFAEIDRAWTPLGHRLDHKTLNDIPGLENPTSENLALWIWRSLADLPGLAEVTISETARSKVRYRG